MYFFFFFLRCFPNHSVRELLKNLWLFFFFWLGKWRPRLRNTFSNLPTANQDHGIQYWPMLWCWSAMCKFQEVFKGKARRWKWELEYKHPFWNMKWCHVQRILGGEWSKESDFLSTQLYQAKLPDSNFFLMKKDINTYLAFAFHSLPSSQRDPFKIQMRLCLCLDSKSFPILFRENAVSKTTLRFSVIRCYLATLTFFCGLATTFAPFLVLKQEQMPSGSLHLLFLS